MAAILLVVGNAGSPTTTDSYVQDILENDLGHTVTLRSDDDSGDVTGFDGAVLAESCSSATLSTKYDTAAVPIVIFEPGVIDEMRLVPAAGNGQTSEDTIDIHEQNHPIMDGPFGTAFGVEEAIYSSAGDISWYGIATGGALPAGVTSVASLDESAGNNVTVMACESGATLASGTAPEKRAFMGWPREALSGNVNASGLAMLQNAFAWAFGQEAEESTGTLLRPAMVI